MNLIFKYLKIGIILLISFTSVFSQKPVIEFDHLTNEDGLPNSTINTLLQDKYGFLWFGTYNGLSRFDGYHFTVYKNNSKKNNTISDNRINILFEDREGTLYVGTWDQGLNIYNRASESFTRYQKTDQPNSISSNKIYSIAEDSKGYIWIGTPDAGLSRFDKKTKQFKQIAMPASYNNTSCVAIAIDKNDNLWLTNTGDGLFKYQPDKDEFTMINNPLQNDANMTGWNKKMLFDKKGFLWIATRGTGLYRYDTQNNTMQHWLSDLKNPNSISSNMVYDILEKDDNYMWIATDGGGINLFDIKNNIFYQYTNNQGIANTISTNAVYCLFKDKAGIVWIGTFSGGVNIYNPYKQKFPCYRPNPQNTNSLIYKSVLAIYQDRDNDIIIGTDGGGFDILKTDKDGEKFVHYRPDKANPLNSAPPVVKAIFQDSEGNIWFGTWSKGLVKFDKKTGNFKYFPWNDRDPNTLSGPDVWCFSEDSKKQLWIGVLGRGLDVMDIKTEKIVKKYNSFDNSGFKGANVFSIYKDSKNRYWSITEGDGINKYIEGTDKFVNYQNDPRNYNSLSFNDVRSVFEDSKGQLWFGTLGGGINLYNERTEDFTAITESDGLISNTVMGILEDNAGNLWISTNKGMCKYNPKTKKFRNYDVADGLQANEFNYCASIKSKSGRFYFGGINGFNAFFPEKIVDNSFKPPVFITSFSIFNRPITVDSPDSILNKSILETKDIVLSYDKSVFTFEFAALNYIQTKKNQYAFMMENFEKDWNYVGYKRDATYTNLDPGTYYFKVKASNNDQVWNEEGVTIKITITPPFWKTWWFRLLFSLLIAGGAVGFYFYRMNQIKRKNAHLEKLVKERTADLMKANGLLLEHQEEILQQNEEINAQKELVQEQNQDLESAYHNMQTISEFGQQISATLEIDVISEVLYHYLSANMDISIFGIAIYNPIRQILAWKSFLVDGKSGKYFEYATVDNSKLATYCFNSRNEILIDKFFDNTEYGSRSQDIADNSSASLIYIPLVYEDKPVGVFSVQSKNVNAYTRKEYSVIRSIASYISISINNAETFEIVNAQNKKITDSIKYAQKIQATILPEKEMYSKYIDSFVIYRPKDVVSGDFYWFAKPENADFLFLAAVDCTGHGVPGAFMSMIGGRLLNEIVSERRIFSPSEILNLIDEGVIKALKQEKSDNSDGMDICLCRYDLNDKTLCFSGAKSPLWQFECLTGEMLVHKGSRRYIGGKKEREKTAFTETTIQVAENDVFYLATDGFTDQNNSERARYGSPRLLQNLKLFAHKPMEEQKQLLEKGLSDFMKSEEQRDDITVWGVRFV